MMTRRTCLVALLSCLVAIRKDLTKPHGAKAEAIQGYGLDELNGRHSFLMALLNLVHTLSTSVGTDSAARYSRVWSHYQGKVTILKKTWATYLYSVPNVEKRQVVLTPIGHCFQSRWIFEELVILNKQRLH